MVEEHTADDQSHYEISLTAGQAFVAFVLLLLSLAASFAFGLMLGKGQADERLVVRKETPVVTEANVVPKKNQGEIVELGVTADDFEEGTEDPEAIPTDSSVTVAPVVEEEAATSTAAAAPPPVATASAEPAPVTPAPVVTTPVAPAHTASAHAASAQVGQKVPHLAQLLSTSDQKIAEAMAVKLINRGFNTAYVERGATDKGAVYRVRVRFDSEPDARAAEPKLKEFSKEVWITAR
ncbi:MAG TPA: SPOR domain-containing protein [Thermoanaerobaculia bacterium]|nr:SPOR domain-containing protein [Thermoanaerobaculia bacterium]